MADFENEVMRSLGRIESKVDDHTEKFKELKHEREVKEWRDWVKVVVMLPIITVLHAILNKLGIKV